MKKLVAMTLAILLVIGLTACDNDVPNEETKVEVQTESGEITQSKTEAVKSSGEVSLEALMEADETPTDKFEFEGTAGEEFYLGAYYGEDKIVSLPSKYKDTPVTGVTSYIFTGECSVEALRIPETVKMVDEYVCTGNSNLQIVVIEGAEKIGQSSFLRCPKLHTVVLNDGLTEIAEYAFAECESLKEITIPASVASIHFSSFMNCAEGLTIHGEAGSYAETYAQENEINFVVE